MTLLDYIKAGGEGSGCNPEVGQCGRKPEGLSVHESTVKKVQKEWDSYYPDDREKPMYPFLFVGEGADRALVVRQKGKLVSVLLYEENGPDEAYLHVAMSHRTG